MSLGLVFWIIMLLWLLFGLYWRWPFTGAAAVAPLGGDLMLFVLLLLLGWRVFGAPIHG